MAKANLTDLFNEVGNLLGADSDQFEIEARIGTFKGQRFVSSVDPKDFYRVLDYFLTHEGEIYDYIPDQVSVLTRGYEGITSVPDHPDVINEAIFEVYKPKQQFPVRIRESWVGKGPRFYGTKKTIGHVDLRNYYTRIAKSKEQNLPSEPNPIPQGLHPQAFRVKERWSFALKDQQETDHPLWPFRIDLTRVNGYTHDEKGKQYPVNTHEIELEVINFPITDPYKDLWPGIRFILQKLQDSPFAIPAHVYSNVVVTFNDLFDIDIQNLEASIRKNRPQWKFHREWRLYNPVNKPVNFKRSAFGTPNTLAITDKADGERKLMFVRTDGAYLLYPPQDILKFIRVVGPNEKTDAFNVSPETVKALADTVIDGELVTFLDGSRKFLAFDILINNGKDVRSMKFAERYALLKGTLQKNPMFPIELKTFSFPDQDTFYHRTNTLLEEIPNKPYRNDGLIFNAVNETYTEGTVYKWKPISLLSIDFSLGQDPGNPDVFYLLVKDDRSDKLLYFQGTPQYPSSGTISAQQQNLKIPLKAGQIVEMTYNVETGEFIPQRIRHDRDIPNKSSTAISVWRDIHDPITEESIRGTDLKAMRHYHNIIKRNLLERCGKGSFILDIGSGHGGDVLKWRDIGASVLAVEPNPEHLQVIAQRLFETGYKQESPGRFVLDKSIVVLLQASGQDYEQIILTFKKHFGKGRGSHPVNCIALFNVLTFFYDAEDSLNRLVYTITELLEEQGHVIGLVMDGGLVRQLLINHYHLKERLKKLKPDQYYNIDTKTAINEKSFKKLFKNDKYRIVSANKSTLAETVKMLLEKDPDQVSEPSWKISKESDFTDDPYGNKIKIHLDDTIVTDQTEFLVDFEALVEKLAAQDIDLKENWFLSKPELSESQSKLNELYRAFVFKRMPFVPEPAPVQLTPLIGLSQKKLKEATAEKSRIEGFLAKAKAELAELEGKSGKQVKEALAKTRQKIAGFEARIEQLISEIGKFEKETQVAAPVIKPTGGKPRPKPLVPPTKFLPTLPGQTPVVKPIAKPIAKPIVKPIVKPVAKPVAKPKPLQPGGSVQIQEEISFAPSDVFVAVPEATYSILGPEEREPFDFQDNKFIRIGNFDRGICLVYAMLRARFDNYISGYNSSKQKGLTPDVRKKRQGAGEKVFGYLLGKMEDNYNTAVGLDTVREYYADWKTAKNKVQDCQNWPWLGLYEFLARNLQVNLTVIETTGPNKFQVQKTNTKFPNTVTLFFHDGLFDTLATENPDGSLTTLFPAESLTL